MKINNTPLIILLSLIILACQQSPEKEVADQQIISLTSPAEENSGLPFLHTGADQKLYMSWVTMDEDSAFLFSSQLDETDQWSSPKLIAKGDDWFVNWADYPQIAVNENGDGLAHFLQKSADGTYTYDIKITQFVNDQGEWTTPQKLHNDTVQAEHGFISMFPHEGKFFVCWLDGRNTSGHGHESHSSDEETNPLQSAMTIRSAVVHPGGEIKDRTELDAAVCDCCQTSTVMTSTGPAVVYRNRSEEEIRDIYITRFADGAWTTPKPVFDDKWKIAGCPVNGPKIDASGDHLAVAWFSASDNKPQVKISFSGNNGADFDEPILIADSSALGRVDLIMLSPTSAIVSWLESGVEQSTIKAAMIERNQGITSTFDIAKTSASRASGFPQMAKWGNTIYFAWTETGEKSKIRFAKMSN